MANVRKPVITVAMVAKQLHRQTKETIKRSGQRLGLAMLLQAAFDFRKASCRDEVSRFFSSDSFAMICDNLSLDSDYVLGLLMRVGDPIPEEVWEQFKKDKEQRGHYAKEETDTDEVA